MTRLLIVLLTLVVASGTSAQTHLGRVSIDNVTNQINDAGQLKLIAGSLHNVSIRYNFTALPSGWWNSSNAFELYSPDGANWVNLLGTFGQMVDNLPPSVSKLQKYLTSSNNGVLYASTIPGGHTQPGGSTGPNSRVAYMLATFDGTGASGFVGGPGGTNGIAVILQFQTLATDAGKTMCLDTTQVVTVWEWAAPVVGSDFPIWDNGLGVSGPRCWDIYHLPCVKTAGRPGTEGTAMSRVGCLGCCNLRVGDANNSGDDEPTVGDISTLIDFLFISGGTLTCIEEADVNQSGGATPYADDITIGDVSALIDYLFITGPQAGTLPACM